MSLKFKYKIMKGFIMKKLTILFLTIFLCSCTKKQLITSDALYCVINTPAVTPLKYSGQGTQVKIQ